MNNTFSGVSISSRTVSAYRQILEKKRQPNREEIHKQYINEEKVFTKLSFLDANTCNACSDQLIAM